MATNAYGRDIKVALSKAITWNSPKTPQTFHGQLITDEGMGVIARESLPSPSIGNRAPFTIDTDKGSYPLDKRGFTQEFRLDHSEFPLMLAMGTAATASATTGALVHILRPKADIDGIFGTLAFERKENSIMHTYATVKFDDFSLVGEAGAPMMVSYNMYVSRFMNSGGVTTLQMDGVDIRQSVKDDGLRLIFGDDTTIWLNDQSSATLTSSDLVCPSRVELIFNRGLEAYHAACGGGNAKGIVQEPTGGQEHPQIELLMTFPTYTDDTYVTDLGADTHKKMRLRAVHAATAGASSSYVFELYCTNMEVLNIDTATSGGGKIEQPLRFRLKDVYTVPEGMEYTDPFYMKFTNKIQTLLTSL